MERQCTGRDIIVQILKAAGVDCLFGIISIHNIPIYDAIARQGGIRTVANRSEPGAVSMADGYAKATGKLGVVITSTGAGAGNTAGSVIEAQTNGTPLLRKSLVESAINHLRIDRLFKQASSERV